MPPIYSTLNYNHPLWPQIAEKNGDVAKGEPSFGGKLLFNALRWAGEPSQKIAGFGGRDILGRSAACSFRPPWRCLR